MKINIKSKNLNLSPKQKEMVLKKIKKLAHFADRLQDESAEFRVELKHGKTRKPMDAYSCQLTIFAPSAVLRAETRGETLENAIDKCLNKIKGPIDRYKAKIHRSGKKVHPAKTVAVPEKEPEFEIPKILRRKRFSDAKPLTEEEAIEKMELINHDFFLFNNADTGRFSIVYKRKDGYYGIIEPKMAKD